MPKKVDIFRPWIRHNCVCKTPQFEIVKFKNQAFDQVYFGTSYSLKGLTHSIAAASMKNA